MNNTLKYIAVGTAGLVVGGAVGFVIATKRADKIIAREIDRVEAAYSSSLKDAHERITKTGKYGTVDEAAAVLLSSEEQELVIDEEDVDIEQWRKDNGSVDVKDFIEQFKQRSAKPYGGVTFPGQETIKDPDAEEETTQAPESEVYDDTPKPSVPEFVTVRDPNGPYLISIDEFMDDEETPFSKVDMTFFEGDETLVDTRDQIIPDIDTVVGSNNLNRFGEGTTDPDQMYIRNERLEMDIELTRDEGTYTRKILGIIPEDELQRSMTKPLKMRESDDS